MPATSTERITRQPGVCGGKWCIAGHRIRVMDIVEAHELFGQRPDEIVASYPTLSLSDVHTALAFYYDHAAEIRREMEEEEQEVEAFRRNHPSPIQDKLDAVLKRLR